LITGLPDPEIIKETKFCHEQFQKTAKSQKGKRPNFQKNLAKIK
jgi:hypothetical protein